MEEKSVADLGRLNGLDWLEEVYGGHDFKRDSGVHEVRGSLTGDAG
jgi:hypothetical protein